MNEHEQMNIQGHYLKIKRMRNDVIDIIYEIK